LSGISKLKIIGYKAGVDNGNYLEPHLALFMRLQEAYPEYKQQFV
jgi:hypothetical protein